MQPVTQQIRVAAGDVDEGGFVQRGLYLLAPVSFNVYMVYFSHSFESDFGQPDIFLPNARGGEVS